MQGSIGRHHVEYRIGSRSPAAAALLPAIDRALQQALASAIEQRLARALGDDGQVVVIREATAHAVLHARDCALTSAIVDRVSASAADAVVSIVAAPAGSDTVMRFASETEFVGSFIVEVLAGTALNRWFFGPLHKYARDTPAETIAAVLADHDAAQVLRWLKEHGHALPGGDAAASRRDLLSGDSATSRRERTARDVTPLAAAAFQILGAIGWDVSSASWADLQERFAAATPQPPNWREAASLTTWVIDFMRFVTAAEAAARGTRSIDPAAADPLLHGTLDWLDVPLVRAALADLASSSPHIEATSSELRAMPADGRPSGIVDRIIGLITDRVRQGMWMPPPGGAGDVARSLVASMAGAEPGVSVEPIALIVRIERIVAACFTLIADRARKSMPPAPMPFSSDSSAVFSHSGPVGVAEAIATLTEAGPAASGLLQHLIGPVAADAAGELTPYGGLFLLTRPVSDVKLPMLARDAAIPLASVLSIVARTLFSAEPPFDGPTRFWIGSSEPDVLQCALDDERLGGLRVALEELLFDQHLRAATIADDAAHPRIVTLLVRAWARWLPALHDASLAFLVRNCLSRAARVRVTDAAVDVVLDPAPLDVVLEMAGCFRAIDAVGWLGGRRMSFAVTHRRPQAT